LSSLFSLPLKESENRLNRIDAGENTRVKNLFIVHKSGGNMAREKLFENKYLLKVLGIRSLKQNRNSDRK
jgi:hypothetical protein